MAESDLDIRIRLQNEASGEIDAIKKEVEDAADAVAKLSEAPSEEMSKFLEDLATKIKEFASQADATGESFAGFLEGISSAINNAADQLKDAFPDDSEFLGGIVDALTEVVEGLDGTKDGSEQASVGIGDLGDQFVIAGQKAQKANDQFTQASAAANPTAGELATAATLGAGFVGPQTSGPTLAEFALLQEAVKQTGVEFDVTAAKKDSFRGNLTGLEGDLRRADIAAAEFNRALISSQEAMNAKKLAEFQQAAFGVDKALAQGVAEVERYAAALNHLLASSDPAVGAQIRLSEATKVLDFALKQGWISLERYNIELKKLQQNADQAGKATTGLAGFFNGLKTAILGTALGFTAAQIAIQLFQKAMAAVTQGFTDAAQTQQLNTALQALAASTNTTVDSINQAVVGLEKMGFAGSAAREAVTRLIQSELDVADAIKLGLAARNQAIVTGQKEAQVLETLINGIANRNSRALRSIRLTIDQSEAEDKYARAIEKTSDQLTRSEKQAAIMAAALEQINKAAGAAAAGQDDFNVVLNKFEVQFAEMAEKSATALLPLATAFVKLGAALVEFVDLLFLIPGISFPLQGLVLVVKFLAAAFEATTISIKFFALDIEDAWNHLLKTIRVNSKAEFDAIAKDIEKRRAEVEKQRQEFFTGKKPEAPLPIDALIPKLPKAQDVQHSLDALIGPQVKQGFRDLSKEGKDAIDNLTRVIGDFGTAVEDGGTGVVTTLEEIDRAILSTFSKQKTPGDILNFMEKVRESAQALGIDLSNIEREGAFRRQKALLDELQATMSGYLAISKELLSIQKSYNSLLADGVQHELAMQQIAAEVVDDKAKVIALQFRANAEQLVAAQENFKLEQDTIRRDTEKQQAERKIQSDRRGDVRDLADFIISSDRDMNQKLRKSSEDYYGTLKGLQQAAREGWKAAALEVKNLREAQESARLSAATSIRELEKQLRGPAFSLRDTMDEISEKVSSSQAAAAKNNFTRAKEELARARTLAQQLGQQPGFNRRAQEELEAIAQLEDEQFDKQRKIAELKEQSEKTTLKNATEAIKEANKLMVTLGEKIKISFDADHLKTEADKLHKGVQAKFDKDPIKATLVGAEGGAGGAVAGLPGTGEGSLTGGPGGATASPAATINAVGREATEAIAGLERVNKQIEAIKRQLTSEQQVPTVFNAMTTNLKLSTEELDKLRASLKKLEAEKAALELKITPPVEAVVTPAAAQQITETIAKAGTEGFKAISYSDLGADLQARLKARFAALEVPTPDTKKVETAVSTATEGGAKKGIEDAQKWSTAAELKWVKIDPKNIAAETATALAATPPVPIKLEPAALSLQNSKEQIEAFFKAQPVMITARLVAEALSTGQSLTTLSGRAQGGVIPGHSPNATADNLLGWLTAGEYVQPVAAVRHYGTEFMESIRRMQFPRFAEGGMVGASSVHAVSSAEKETTLHLTFQGKSLGRVRGPSDTVRDITSALKELSRGVA